MGKIVQSLRQAICLIIKGYRILISPLLGQNCRYLPSCSEYTQDAILQHGIFKGGFMAMKRLLRCQPWGGHGYDPVPSTDKKQSREY